MGEQMHAADSHELIRVHGARVNNLKDVSVEIPKRRLTVFTGVSGSGNSIFAVARRSSSGKAGSVSSRFLGSRQRWSRVTTR